MGNKFKIPSPVAGLGKEEKVAVGVTGIERQPAVGAP
jgi:hypothetical protein